MTDRGASAHSSNTHLMVPMFIFAVLLGVAAIRGPALISNAGIGSAIIVVAPLILATYALTVIVMAGRAGVDLSIGPLIGFINVGLIQLLEAGVLESPITFFLYAMIVGVAYQLVMGLIIVYVRVQPIIVSLSGYLALVGLNLIILPRPGGVAPEWMLNWGSGTEIWSPVLIILIVATAAWYALANTAFFAHLRLMGSDERAAYTSGVKINIVRLGAHCIAGVYAGLAAICFTSLISSGDPTQGTTFTLMAVTALVLGGANLAGGRGGALGSMLGALNIYLINYLLGTFNFGRFQSFVTDLSYGTILVLSLLISLALPQIQKGGRYLSPAVFIAILAAIAGGVIMHAVMDIGSVPAIDAGVMPADTGSDAAPTVAESATPAGTYVLYVILGIAAVTYLGTLAFRYARAPMVAFLVIIAVIVLGMIFHDPVAAVGGGDGVGAASRNAGLALQYLALEGLDFAAKSSTYEYPVISGSYAIILALGVTLLATVIIRLNLPEAGISSLSVPVVLSGLVIVGIAVLAIVAIKLGGLIDSSSTEVLIVALTAMLLFVLVFSPLQARIPDVSNVYFVLLGLLAFGFVYFMASPAPTGEQAMEYAPSVFNHAPAGEAVVTYPVPGRLNASLQADVTATQWAYSILTIVLLQFAVWKAMAGERLIRRFWRFGHIVLATAIAWGALFYSVGVSLWQIAIILAVAIVTAPLVWRAFGSFARNLPGEVHRQ